VWGGKDATLGGGSVEDLAGDGPILYRRGRKEMDTPKARAMSSSQGAPSQTARRLEDKDLKTE